MFDTAEIVVSAGNGGDGAISFRREKYVPFGGPDGGDGGRGGDVIIRAEATVTDLRAFKRKGLYRAGGGGDGSGQRRHGKKGKELVLEVPEGTIVSERGGPSGDEAFTDLERAGQQVVVANGGKGGLGNTHFASSINQAPRIAQKGGVGEERTLGLEMRLIADVGIIGYPNVGKSTLLTTASAAKPEIADYPFTTREPILGMVEVEEKRFVLAEIPGLVDDAHLGRGLGHDFLRHITRTRILIHLIDGCAVSLVENMVRVNRELGLFDPTLVQKPQLVAVNKIDLPEVQARLAEIKGAFSSVATKVCFVSAATGEGVPELMAEAMDMLSQVGEAGEKIARKVFRPQPKSEAVSVHKEGDTFVVVAAELERIVARVDMSIPGVRWQLDRQLARLGVSKALQKAGVKSGDRVRCSNLEWEW